MSCRNEQGTGCLDRLDSIGCSYDKTAEPNQGIHALPPCLVYPLLGLLIGGFIAWGEVSGGKHLAVEDDDSGVLLFWVLLIGTCATFYAMFLRLDRLSHKEERHRIYSRIPATEPSHVKRHRFCVSAPWDSYQWGAGALLIAISEIFLGVCFPALSGPVELAFAYTWMAFFGLTWSFIFIFMCIDPSQGLSEETRAEQRNRACETPTAMVGVEQVGGPGSLTMYCKLSGCQRYYSGKYRKHCKACNKCVEGFDHHCPFLNQCIGTNNYFWFMAILTSYVALMVASIMWGLAILFQLHSKGDGVADYAKKVWGTELFALFTSMLVIFPLPKLYFMVPLWVFHLKLCGLTWATGEFHGTYMFTRDWNTNDLRGRHAYLDERARNCILHVVHYYMIDRWSAFELWKAVHGRSKTVRSCRQRMLVGWSSVLNQMVEKQMGVNLTGEEGALSGGPPLKPIRPGPRVPSAPPHAMASNTKAAPSESDPLLQPVAAPEDRDPAFDEELGLPAHQRKQAAKGCLPACKPSKDKRAKS